MTQPTVVVFDVNETLSDLRPLRHRFTDLGAPAHLARLWFTAVLREGIGLAAAGTSERFTVIGADVLRELLDGRPLDRDMDAAIEHVLSGFTSLPTHPDVPAGVRALRAAGYRLVTLSNGSASIAETLLTSAGVGEEFEAFLSVDDAGVWKPAAPAYRYAAEYCEVPLERMLLVAVHPWDLNGAARAGMTTAWLNRSGARYPVHCAAPTRVAGSLTELADTLG